MRLPAWVWLALSSISAGILQAETRPRYGGTLALELSTVVSALDPATLPASIASSIAETLVKTNAHGGFDPLLALNWQHDPGDKRWRFSLRPKVTFHDGEPLTATTAAPALRALLKKKYGDVVITTGGQTIVVQSDRPMPDLLSDLGRPESAIFRKSEAVPLIGTGPFRVSRWENNRLTLAAFDDYWGGRPFLDSVVVTFAAAPARGDIFEIPFAPTHRVLPEGVHVAASPPVELVALLVPNPQSTLAEALSLSIDRAPIVNVLTQRRGEPAFGLLPQWLSGYAFLFQSTPDLARAKQLIAQLRLPPISLSYPAADSFARAIADRVALNARDAGIIIQPATAAGGNLALIRWQLESSDAAAELKRLCAFLGAPERAASIDTAKPESFYQIERALLEDRRLIPLVYIPKLYAVNERVHGWDAAQKAAPLRLNIEALWVER